MKKMIFAMSLFVGLFTSVFAQAADMYNFENLGFSPAGSYFSFAETVIQDGSGFPKATVYVVDVTKNTLVSTKTVMIQDESTYDETVALKKAIAKSDLKRFAIKPGTNKGQDVALYKQSEKRALFTLNNDYEINVTETDVGNLDEPGGWCFDIGSGSKMITVTLSKLNKGQEKTITLQQDTHQPKSRYCSSLYTIEKVITHGNNLVVLLSYLSPAFEGPDRNYMVVTGKLF